MPVPNGFDLERICAAAKAYYQDNLVALAVFGSVGRHVATEASDVDLLVVLQKRPRGRSAAMRDFQGVEDILAAQPRVFDLSPVFRTPEDLQRGFALLLDMTEDATILFDPHGTLEGALSRLRRRLLELGAKRIPYKGSWYWDLKPDYVPGEIFHL